MRRLAALLFGLVLLSPGPASGRTRIAFELGGSGMVQVGTVLPAQDSAQPPMLVSIEVGAGPSLGRLCPMLGLRYSIATQGRPVPLSDGNTALVRPYELAPVLSLAWQPAGPLLVRADVAPTFVLADGNSDLTEGFRHDASADNPMGICLGTTVGVALGPVVFGVRAGYASWSSPVTAVRYERTVPFVWTKTGQGSARFLTRGLRFGTCLSLRLGA